MATIKYNPTRDFHFLDSGRYAVYGGEYIIQHLKNRDVKWEAIDRKYNRIATGKTKKEAFENLKTAIYNVR